MPAPEFLPQYEQLRQQTAHSSLGGRLVCDHPHAGRHSSAKTPTSNSHFETSRIRPTAEFAYDFRPTDRVAESPRAFGSRRSRPCEWLQKSFSQRHSKKEKCDKPS